MASLAVHLATARGLLKNQLEAELLLAHVLNKSREFLIAYPEFKLSVAHEAAFERLLNERQRGKPIAYLTRRKEFFGIDLYVDERCLIPRPETEFLVEEVIRIVKTAETVKTVLDVGTGSGAIAIAIANSLPQVRITATDISEQAIEVARINATQCGLENRVEFIISDLLENITDTFDIIVANLPYIGEQEFNFVEKNVAAYEPREALFGGADGLALYQRLFEQIALLQKKPRYFLGEFGFLQRERLSAMLNTVYGKTVSIDFRKDFASLDRIFIVGF